MGAQTFNAFFNNYVVIKNSKIQLAGAHQRSVNLENVI